MPTTAKRRLVVTADDFGIGIETSRGILDLGKEGIVTSTVLLVNSPHAAESVDMWHQAGQPVELGWHPCLTLDSPVLPAEQVPTLTGHDGRFNPLGTFLKRLLRGQISERELMDELNAQYDRYLQLVGSPPQNVNGHHHVHAFGMVGRVIRSILSRQTPKPFLRRVSEPMSTKLRVPGARFKRMILSAVGSRAAKQQEREGFPGATYLAGITDPKCVADPDFFVRWISRCPGEYVELTCHPGYFDETLFGRDGTKEDGNVERRAYEWNGLSSLRFINAVERAGFELHPAGAYQKSTKVSKDIRKAA
ncbi:MAG: ChbG/HpnK family deacetylase [Gemmataceae bacterium]